MQTRFKQQSPSYSSSTYFSTGTLATAAIVLPVGHPQNPYANESMIRYRFSDVDHNTEVTSDTQRVVVGVRGTWWGWDAEAAAMFSNSDTGVTTTGLLRDSVLINEVLDANGKARSTFNFGSPSKNDAGLMSRLYPTLKDKGTTSTSSVDLRGTRDLMSLGGGMMAVAVGGEVRGEKFTSTPDALTSAGELSVLGASSSDGSRTVSALYAELSMPFFKSLETSLAARVDSYSDFGSAVTPKFSLKYKPASWFAFRTTMSSGFRAPALTETSSSPTTGFYSGIRDPKLCADPSDPANANNDNCSLSVKSVSGSNPALKPERSNSLTWGIVVEPTDNTTVTLDFYNILRKDEITGLDPDYLLAHESEYPGLVVRKADGTIDQLNTPYSNLGSTHVRGLDLEVKSKFNLGANGKLTVIGAYNAEPYYRVASVAGAPEDDWAGTYTQPTRRAKLGYTWERGPWTNAVTWNMTGDYLRAFTVQDLSCSYSTGKNPELCKVAAQTTADLFLGYKGFKNLDLGMTIRNISNEQPPVDERRAGRYTLFGSTFHSAMGRFISVNAKYTFW
jgi:iron complex outermembrane receptor protein